MAGCGCGTSKTTAPSYTHYPPEGSPTTYSSAQLASDAAQASGGTWKQN